MFGIALELQSECRGCGLPVPINAFAEHFVCGACQHQIEIDAGVWNSILNRVIGDRTSQDRSLTEFVDGKPFHVRFGHQEPKCGTCKALIPETARSAPGAWTCAGCGGSILVRAAPALLAARDVVALVGENPNQVHGTGTAGGAAAARASSPVAFHCPNCSAALPVDGSSRTVRCEYCSKQIFLPDAVWQRLHPVEEVSPWYLWLPNQHKSQDFQWDELNDAVIDAQSNIYCVGSGTKGGPCIWCLAPDFEVRWVSKPIDDVFSGFMDEMWLSLDPKGGRLLLRAEEKHSLAMFSVADGSFLGRLGGKRPEGTTAAYLDLEKCKQLCADIDGTILSFTEVGGVDADLARFAPDGSPIDTWPGGFFETLFAPSRLDEYSIMRFGPDGRFYIIESDEPSVLRCVNRRGKSAYRIPLPPEANESCLQIDAAGRAYLLGHPTGSKQRELLRVSADGKRVEVVAKDRRAGGALGGEKLLLVAGDGSIYQLGERQRYRLISPDGKLLRQSRPSHDAEAEEDQEAARENE